MGKLYKWAKSMGEVHEWTKGERALFYGMLMAICLLDLIRSVILARMIGDLT